MNSKRLSLALPLVSIGLIVAGMTQGALAASAQREVKSALTGINMIEKIQDRAANRAASRRDEVNNEDSSDKILSMFRKPVTRRASSQSSRRSSARSSSSKSSSSSSQTALRPAAPVIQEVIEELEIVSGNPGTDINAEVFKLVNEVRAAEGLPAYTYNNTLEESAMEYAVHMRIDTCFSHSECGSTLKERMHASGYYKDNGRSYSYGENIARGQDSAADVMEDWMNSPPHKGAILSTKFKEIGIGRSGDYWVQHFGAVR